jgi:hypothetical protein
MQSNPVSRPSTPKAIDVAAILARAAADREHCRAARDAAAVGCARDLPQGSSSPSFSIPLSYSTIQPSAQ